MKTTTLLLLFITLISCNTDKDYIQKKDSYPRKDRFIVSENDARLDSITTEFSNGNISLERFEFGLHPSIATGGIHFIIDNENTAYYLEKPDYLLLCGNVDTSDSIFLINETKSYLDSIQFIKPKSISNFLLNNKTDILNSEIRNFPRTISFALKNDTLQGSLMHDILTTMNSAGMNSYFIRRMNSSELQAIQNFSKQ